MIDPAQHMPVERLEAGLAALPAAPAKAGALALIVARRSDGLRDTPHTAALTVEGGLPGDRWAEKPERDRNMQITVMRRDVAVLIANGQPLTLFGDNFFVDLDIAAVNLPAGTRLSVGACLLEVTPEPHTGCRTFRDRFGADALRFTQLKHLRGLNLRGMHWKVVEGGDVSVGDRIEVISRP